MTLVIFGIRPFPRRSDCQPWGAAADTSILQVAMGCGPRGRCSGDRQSTRRRPGDQGQPGDPALFHRPKQVTATPELRGRTSVNSRAALADTGLTVQGQRPPAGDAGHVKCFFLFQETEASVMPRESPGPCLGPLSQQLAGSRAAPCESQAGPRGSPGHPGRGTRRDGAWVGGRCGPAASGGEAPRLPRPHLKWLHPCC